MAAMHRMLYGEAFAFFLLSLPLVQVYGQCDGLPKELTASIELQEETTPGYDTNGLVGNMDCTWTIGPTDRELMLVLHNVEIGSDTNELLISVSIGTIKLMPRLNGPIASDMYSSTAGFTINLRTIPNLSDLKGFKFSYAVAPPADECSSGAIKQVTDYWQYATSPNFPKNLDRNINCTTEFITSAGNAMIFDFVWLDLKAAGGNTCADVLKFTNVDDNTDTREACAQIAFKDPSLSYIMRTTRTKLQLQTAPDFRRYFGYYLRFRSVPDYQCFTATSPPLDVIAVSQFLANPGFPSLYLTDVVCTYKFQAPLGETINIDILWLDMGSDTGSCSETLTITDSDNTTLTGPMCAQTAANDRPLSYTTTANKAQIQLSGGQSSGIGFFLRYYLTSGISAQIQCISCNSALHASCQTVTSSESTLVESCANNWCQIVITGLGTAAAVYVRGCATQTPSSEGCNTAGTGRICTCNTAKCNIGDSTGSPGSAGGNTGTRQCYTCNSAIDGCPGDNYLMNCPTGTCQRVDVAGTSTYSCSPTTRSNGCESNICYCNEDACGRPNSAVSLTGSSFFFIASLWLFCWTMIG